MADSDVQDFGTVNCQPCASRESFSPVTIVPTSCVHEPVRSNMHTPAFMRSKVEDIMGLCKSPFVQRDKTGNGL